MPSFGQIAKSQNATKQTPAFPVRREYPDAMDLQDVDLWEALQAFFRENAGEWRVASWNVAF
jgi:hypothetical protein